MVNREGKETPMGKVVPPGPERIYDNYTPGADHPKNDEARGGYGNRDDKEGFGSDTAGDTAIGVSEAHRRDEDNTRGYTADKSGPANTRPLSGEVTNAAPDEYDDLEGSETTKAKGEETNGENMPVI